jgi:hypothetical protein
MKPKKFDRESLLKDAISRIESRKQKHERQSEDEIPPGWFNADEIGAVQGKKRTAITNAMRKLGVPSKTFMRLRGNYLRPIPYYNP